jgi:mannosyl-3-phosphoglycerate phosphatase
MAVRVKPKIVIFTDLDGTLLDHQTYSFKKALPALTKIKKTATPVVFVTSKTFAEVQTLQKKMNLWLKEPFIVENGGAIFIPNQLFNFDIKKEFLKEKILKNNKFLIIEFGDPYQKIRKILKKAAKKTGLNVIGTGDRTIKGFAKITGLASGLAKKAKQRKYQEGFTIENVQKEKLPAAQKQIKKEIKKMGFYMSIGGRFYQISSIPAKTKAAKILIALFKKKYGKIHTLGLGDAQADLKFIKLCNEGYLIRNPKKIVAGKTKSKITKTKETGPNAWNKIILKTFKKFNY